MYYCKVLEDEDYAFLYVVAMWRESCRSELVQEMHLKSVVISRITCTVCTGWNVASPCHSSCDI